MNPNLEIHIFILYFFIIFKKVLLFVSVCLCFNMSNHTSGTFRLICHKSSVELTQYNNENVFG